MKDKKRLYRYTKKATVPILALAILLTAALIPIGAGPPGAYAADSTNAQVSLTAVSVDKTKGTLVLAATLDAVPGEGLSAVQFKVGYPSGFKLTAATDTLLMSDGEKGTGFTSENLDVKPYFMAFGNMDKDNGGVSSKTGDLAYLTFKADNPGVLGSESETYTFSLTEISAYTLTVEGDSSAKTKYINVNNNAECTYNSSMATVNTMAIVEGSTIKVGAATSEVKAPTVQQAIENAESSDPVTLYVSSGKTAAISKNGVKAIAKAGKSMIVDTDNGSSQLTFNTEAAKNIGDANSGEKLVIVTEKKNNVTINGVTCDAIDFSVTAKLVEGISEKPVTSFGGGEVEVSLALPNSLSSIADLKCWNYTDTNYTVVEGEVKDGKFVFKTNHFSDYIVGTENILNAFKAAKNLSEGVTVSGTVTSFGSSTDDVTVELIKDGEVTASYSATVKGNTAVYSIDGVASGSYILKVAKKDHVINKSPVDIGTTSFSKDVKIYLLGDVNCDGSVDIQDVIRLLNHVNNSDVINGSYGCDINADKSVDIQDVIRLLNHVNNSDVLYK